MASRRPLRTRPGALYGSPNCYLQVGGAAQSVGTIGLLPGESRLCTSEVPVGSRRRVDRTPKLQIADDCPWPQVEVLLDQGVQRGEIYSLGPKGIDHDADGTSHPYSVS